MNAYNRDNFFPDTSIGYLVRAVHQLGYARLDAACAEEGLTGIQWSALIAIHFGQTNSAARGIARPASAASPPCNSTMLTRNDP